MEAPVEEEGAVEEATMEEAGLEGDVRETRASAHTAEVHPAASHSMHPSSKATVHATSKATTAAVKGKRRRRNDKRYSERACGEAFCELVGHPNPPLLSDGSCRKVNIRRPQVTCDFK
jgi:hypothetical protein